MARFNATEHVTNGGIPNEKTLAGLLPPLSTAEQERYEQELAAIELSEHQARVACFGGALIWSAKPYRDQWEIPNPGTIFIV